MTCCEKIKVAVQKNTSQTDIISFLNLVKKKYKYFLRGEQKHFVIFNTEKQTRVSLFFFFYTVWFSGPSPTAEVPNQYFYIGGAAAALFVAVVAVAVAGWKIKKSENAKERFPNCNC